MRSTYLIVLLALLVPAWTTPALAQPVSPVPPDRSGATDAAALQRSLDDIASTLREIASQQRVLLMIRRIELSRDRLQPLEGELRRAREEVRTRGEEIAQMRAIRASFQSEVDEQLQQGFDPSASAEREELERIDGMIELQETRLEDAEQRAMRAEDELGRGRDRIEILDAVLEEMLAALGE